jgi:hypothetical protein
MGENSPNLVTLVFAYLELNSRRVVEHFFAELAAEAALVKNGAPVNVSNNSVTKRIYVYGLCM